MTTTTTVAVNITCPSWCDVSAQEHADVLWEIGGCCDHRSDYVLAEGPSGYITEPLAEPRAVDPINVQLVALTTPDGRPQADPLLYIDDHEVTFEQAENLITTIQRLLEAYRKEARS